jgi:hypothetical protein
MFFVFLKGRTEEEEIVSRSRCWDGSENGDKELMELMVDVWFGVMYFFCSNAPEVTGLRRRSIRRGSRMPSRGASLSYAPSTHGLLVKVPFILVKHQHTLRYPSLSNLLWQGILLPNPPLNRWPFRNPINPLEQARELAHFFLRKPGPLPPLHPSPCPNIRNAVFPFPLSNQVIPFLAVLINPAQPNLKHAIHPQRLLPKPVNRQFGLLGLAAEIAGIPLVWSSAAVPE